MSEIRLGRASVVNRIALPSLENKRREELYEKGYRDYEIAEVCGVSAGDICSWRQKKGLKNIGKNMDTIEKLVLEYDFSYPQIADVFDLQEHIAKKIEKKIRHLQTIRVGSL